MEYKNYQKRKIICSNCGKNGHEYRSCHDPVTSYGIININVVDTNFENIFIKEKFSQRKNIYDEFTSLKYPGIKCLINDNFKIFDADNNNNYQLNNNSVPFTNKNHIMKFNYYRDKIKFMMVSRKFSLGFVEFIRGKYDVVNVSSIVNLFEQMYQDEINFIGKNTYDNILYYFLNRFGESKEIVLNRIYEGKYSNEYCEAKIKFNILSSIDNDINVPVNLYFYTKNIKPKWKKPEWGFPKGRRDRHCEENIECASREFEEETGYTKTEYFILNKIEPVDEIFISTLTIWQ